MPRLFGNASWFLAADEGESSSQYSGRGDDKLPEGRHVSKRECRDLENYRNTIEYKFTVEDPNTWKRHWSAIVPLGAMNGPMFEYACTEGNNDIVNILAGARAAERAKSSSGVPISQK